MGAARRLFSACGLVFLCAASAAAQNALHTRVDSIFAAFDRKDSPGCALGVFHNGRMVYGRGYGMADLQNGLPITTQTVFDIASTSKQFTAAAIILLAQQGKLSLDDDVRRFIPELPAYEKPITIRHLLHHTSGLRDYINLLVWGGASIDERTTAQQALDAIIRQKALNFTPGTDFLYSNSGYFLLAQIVERASGQSLREYLHRNIFQPLGMTSTHVHDDHTMVMPGRAIGYAPSGPNFDVAMSRWEQTGDGAVHTTIEDLLRWDENFYRPRVGGQRLINTMLTRGTLENGDTLNYAAGLVHERFRGVDAVSHNGSWAGYRSELIRFPDHHLSVATLCNVASANPSQLARSVAAVYLAEHLQEPVLAQKSGETRITVAAEALSAWTGDYRNPVTGTPRTLTVADGKLLASFGPNQMEMVPVSENEFSVAFEPDPLRLMMERGADGRRRMRQFVNGREVAVFEEITFRQPSDSTLDAHTGEFYSDELQTTFRLTRDNNELLLHGAAPVPVRLRALSTGEFISGPWTLKFVRNVAGRITGFTMSAGRVRGIRFVRTVLSTEAEP